jgi:hypothetical protein
LWLERVPLRERTGKKEMLMSDTAAVEVRAHHEYHEPDHQVDAVGDTAIASFRYEMIYERDGQRSRASGRDLGVFTREGGQWLAVWRTMLDLAEQSA